MYCKSPSFLRCDLSSSLQKKKIRLRGFAGETHFTSWIILSALVTQLNAQSVPSQGNNETDEWAYLSQK